MASRLVSPQKFLISRRPFALPFTSARCMKRDLRRTFIGNKKCVFTAPIIKKDITPDHNFVAGGNERKSTTSISGSAVDFSTHRTSSTTMNPSPNEEKTEESKNENEDQDAISKPSGTESQSVTYDEEDKYCVEITDGFMKVSMKPVSTTGAKGADSGTTIPKVSTSTAVEDTKTNSSNKQNDGPDSQTRIPETVLQFQRQMRKTQAAKRASTPLDKSQLQIIYDDEHVVVVNKPSGVLTVPGVNSNPSMLTVLYEKYKEDLDPEMKMEHMIVHRLDMDTSGIVVYAKSKKDLLKLQALFRNRDEVSKSYEAVVCGHLPPEVQRGSIDLPLQRDHRFPPFMRVATPRSEREAQEVVKDLKNAGWKKIVKKKAKPSQTLFEVIAREYRCYDGDTSEKGEGGQDGVKSKPGERYPVTRLRLTLMTGRTHQLRVHCASIGHPILGDPAYGIYGEASANGGFEDVLMDELVSNRASMDLQLALDQYVKEKSQVMCLHARELRIQHPGTGKTLSFEQAPAF
mmetsp:Transcript_19616/g.48822  ORF Transcript_19616/g.48822 Transcript_19616/m.48822 type:complete len:516 (+) Transcript_19616:112-1659(+)